MPKGAIEYYEQFFLSAAADVSWIARWLHVVPQPPLARNWRNHDGASAGEIGQAQRKMVVRKAWPPKVDNRGRTVAANASLIARRLHDVPRLPLDQNQRNGASAGKVR
jgi:hypothetical protein